MRAGVVLLLLVGLAGCLGEPATVVNYCAPPVGDSPVRGPADAWVTMVEFADFQCPYCGQASDTLQELAAAYPVDLRLVYKEFPLSFHEHGMSAALAAQCAHAQGLFWEMHDMLYSHQASLDDAHLQTFAGEIGVDLDAWRACITSDEARARIEVDQDLGLQLGVSATPTFFVNGTVIEGAVPLADFERVVDRELARAQASGIARESYYAGLERDACR